MVWKFPSSQVTLPFFGVVCGFSLPQNSGWKEQFLQASMKKERGAVSSLLNGILNK